MSDFTKYVPPQPRKAGHAPRSPAKAKGHDVVLAAIQDKGRDINIQLLSGEKIVGKVVARDKFTISIEQAGGTTYVVYKHAIETFWSDRDASPAPQVN